MVRVPVEIIKQRQQTSKRLAKSIVVDVWKSEGAKVVNIKLSWKAMYNLSCL